jgi:uncharacterized repeat protein (TIGR03803 family)
MANISGGSYKYALRCGLMISAFMAVQPAHAATFHVLYTFQETSDGGTPLDGLIADKKGVLYGTAQYGGDGGGYGVVFELSKKGIEKALYGFAGAPGDGAFPQGSLIENDGNFYGTTDNGGSANLGAVFELKKDGSETLLHSFVGGSDGSGLMFGLLRDARGNLYGSTFLGGNTNNCALGPNGCGTIFKIAKNGKETILHAFSGPDGSYPTSGLIADAQGNLYGTTGLDGASGWGNVFKLAPDGTVTPLYSFTNGSDGGEPGGGLAMDSAGNLYGTTETGGDASCGQGSGCGTAFKLAPNGTETTLYAFKGGSDGQDPIAGVTLDAAGNIYGTTGAGGGGTQCQQGCGTVYEIKTNGKEQVLYAFSGQTDGASPRATLLLRNNVLYGTTESAGSIINAGTVFEITK